MNKNSISVVAIYSLVVAAFSGLARSFIDGEFIWSSFLKTTAITWVLATILGYILYLLVYPKNVQPSTPSFKPSTQYFYNDYVNGFCRVEKIVFGYDGSVTSEFNFLNKEGKYIMEKWYAAASDFCKEGVALIYNGEMYNFINKEGKVMSTNWFYDIDPFVEGIAKVRWKDNTVNFVGIDGKCLWENWCPEIVLDNTAGKVVLSNNDDEEEDNNTDE